MAKAKKSTSSSTKSADKRPSAGSSASPIDTSLAAQSAAKLLLARANTANRPAEAKSESSAFKNLKDSVNKPHLQGMDNLLNSIGTPVAKRSNLPAGHKQVGHNQTFGADVNRSGVPRRTGG
ncbi:MAG: hypothetical protein IT446_12860 [Phycisphaerales bacterium]|nr:hypothetical protein [Phycisphaerales bacterium]